MTTKQTIKRIEENGGLNLQMLRQAYSIDMRYCKVVSFHKWLSGWIQANEGVGRCVAKRVADYYLL